MEEQILDNFQLREIALGKEKGISTEVYESPRYDWLQMREIRLGLEQKLNVKCYAHPGFSYGIMREVRSALLNDISIIKYVKAGYNATTLREIRLAMERGYQLDRFLKKGYSGEQLREIRLSLMSGCRIGNYITPNMRSVQIAQIRRGLEKCVDVSIYADEGYSWQQMQEIRLGLETRLDVTKYMNHFFAWDQMREIRLGLAAGMDVSSYARLQFGFYDMHVRRMAMISNYKTDSSAVMDHDVRQIQNHPICNLYVTSDCMRAYMELKLQNAENNYNTDDIMRLLEQSGIQKGINLININAAVRDEKYYLRFLVAEGKPAVQGKSGYYEYRIDTKKTEHVLVNSDGTVDYQNVFHIEGVKKNQVIVKYHFAENGIGGWNIFGEELPAQKGKELAVLRCEGVEVSPDATTYTAAYDGRTEITQNMISVYKMLLVDGDYKRGMDNIDFDGDVLIKGSVITGMTIRAKHDIIVDGSVEPSTLEAGGNVFIRVGMNGNGNGSITAGKNIYGNYFEKANLIAQGKIYANSLLHCNVESFDKLTVLGSKGIILGGSIYAMAGIEANTIGNQFRIKTKLMIGANDAMLSEMAEVKANHMQCASTIADITLRMEKLEGNLTVPEVLLIYGKLKNALDEEKQEQARLHIILEQWILKMEKDKRAKIAVRKDINPGVVVQTGVVVTNIEETNMNVAIRNIGGSIKISYGYDR